VRRTASQRMKNAVVSTEAARTLGPQLLLHGAPILPQDLRPVQNDRRALAKPRGGLWTSTYDPIYGSAWACWCVAYRYEPFDLHWTVFSIPKSARIAVIDSHTDLVRLIERYPRILRGRKGLDFERLSTEYDGLHLTNEGYLKTRSARSGPSLGGWDCESTLWFRWIFSEWHEVKPEFKDVDRFDDLWFRLSGWSTEDYTCHGMPVEKASKKVYETMLRERRDG
jgi:hypothetical protein